MPENNNPPGKNNATASLVLGIIAVIFWFFGYSSILSIILGIVGLIQASKAKELGYDDAIRTAGFVPASLEGAYIRYFPQYPR